MKTFILLLSLLLLSSSCVTYKKLHKWEQNEKIREYVESYYITLENTENNREGEQDSILQLIRDNK